MHFLIAWACCAVVVWLSLLRNEAVPDQVVALWERFLTLPLIIAAAVTIDRIDRRKIGFVSGAVLIVGSVLVVLLRSLAEQAPTISNRGRPALLAAWWFAFLIALVIAAWWAYRYRRNRYLVQRVVLTGLLVSLVLVNGTLGLAAVAVPAVDNQPLNALSAAVSRYSKIARCTLIADTEPPLRLRYVVQTTLPRAQLTRVRHWDAALSQALSEMNDAEYSAVVVDWSARDTRPANVPVPGLEVTPVATGQAFEGRQLRAYLITARRR
jgi:hypothetical protein